MRHCEHCRIKISKAVLAKQPKARWCAKCTAFVFKACEDIMEERDGYRMLLDARPRVQSATRPDGTRVERWDWIAAELSAWSDEVLGYLERMKNVQK